MDDKINHSVTITSNKITLFAAAFFHNKGDGQEDFRMRTIDKKWQNSVLVPK